MRYNYLQSHTFKCVLFLFVLMFFLVACKGTNPQTDSTENTTMTTEANKPIVPVFGETLKMSIQNPLTLNPLMNKERSVDQVLKLVFEPLFRLDTEGRTQNVLVDSATFSEDFASVTIVIKNDHAFHNGTPLTTKDIAYSIQFLIDAPEDVIYKNCVKNIQKTTIVDDTSMIIYLKQPYAFTLNQLIFPIISKDYHTGTAYNDFMPIGSGDYHVTEFISMQGMHLTAVEGAEDHLYVQNIECNISRNGDVDELSFEQGLIDILTPSKYNWLEYSDEPDTRVMEYTTNYVDFIGFNFKNEMLLDKSFRQAIAYAIDREEIAKKQYLSHVTISDSLIPPMNYMSPGSELKYTFNLDTAKEMLAGASITAISDLRLMVDESQDARLGVAKMIQEDLKEIGLNIIVENVSKEVMLERLQTGDYDMVLTGWKLSNTLDYTSLFHSSQIDLGNNFINYHNEFMDYQLENVVLSTGEDSLRTNIQNFDTLYQEDLPYFTLFFMHSLVCTNQDIYGDLNSTTDFVFNGLENIYIVR